MEQLPIILCIDVEPDERLIDARAQVDWVGFERTYDFFAELRPRLQSATGSVVHFSWFLRMDPQIAHTYGSPEWAARRYEGLFERLQAAGDELGLHTHAWRWDEGSQMWVADIGNQAWVDHCVRMAFAAFKHRFHRPSVSFRFGDRWMNDETLDLLERLGARFDLTVEPGQKEFPPEVFRERFTGSLPDYARVPLRPYRPSKDDFRKRSIWRRRGIWIIPLSAGGVEGPRAARLRYVRRLARRIGIDRHRHRSRTLNLGMDSSDFCQMLDGLVNIWQRPYLALVMRADVCSNPVYQSNMSRSIDHLLSHPQAHRFVFETPAEAMMRL